MNTEEYARQLMVEERHEREHLQDNLSSRAVQEMAANTNHETEERARELLTQDRQHNQHLQENLLERTVEDFEQ
ncbi:hypothetical protein [Gloeothece verrucosa]|uniref:Uncharacterized protein n=1 Tax=Gloeothece verrucosa (strain PCC 7822) TaxID=497965 RepID=E0UBN6_GLOV7|nr:hypothetical protein [Gloeothece verrucosa]ADN13980.1 conserved hypothetical protein [Gloeothece verrucosa PCC 7822]